MRTLAVIFIIWATIVSHTSWQPEKVFGPDVVRGTPVPIVKVPTEDCPDVQHCDK